MGVRVLLVVRGGGCWSTTSSPPSIILYVCRGKRDLYAVSVCMYTNLL